MHQKLLLTATLVMSLAFGCQKQPTQNGQENFRIAPAASTTDLDQTIKKTLLEKGEFWWSSVGSDQVWAALSQSDHVLSVGYKPAQEGDILPKMHEINIKDAQWSAARAEVLAMILKSEQELNPEITMDDLMFFDDQVLPVVDMRILNPATVQILRSSALVRYAEPIGYEPFNQVGDRSSSGCGSNTEDYSITTPSDYTNITPGCKRSWNHSFHKISEAWVNSTGVGATVCIVDTGASDDQENLNEEFNQGLSTGRWVSRLVTLPQATNFWGSPTGSPETPHDQCGHGTSMAGACAAPRGTDGNTAGIAYNANLVTYRAAQDVYLDESREVVGVSNAFTQAGNNSSVRVISMSMGRLVSSSQMRDAIVFANNKGKLIFCAAGTSFSWTSWFAGVIYPASLTEVVAVTGVKDNLTNRCSNCHDGSKVDFVVVMEKVSNGKNPLSLADYGDHPSTVGGSSVATASTAGMAALVFGKYPGWTKTQVYNRLKASSSNASSRHSTFGWGRINAQLATQ